MFLVWMLLISCGGLALCGLMAWLADGAATALFQGPEMAEVLLGEDSATA